jgi:hypothetical protein
VVKTFEQFIYDEYTPILNEKLTGGVKGQLFLNFLLNKIKEFDIIPTLKEKGFCEISLFVNSIEYDFPPIVDDLTQREYLVYKLNITFFNSNTLEYSTEKGIEVGAGIEYTGSYFLKNSGHYCLGHNIYINLESNDIYSNLRHELFHLLQSIYTPEFYISNLKSRSFSISSDNHKRNKLEHETMVYEMCLLIKNKQWDKLFLNPELPFFVDGDKKVIFLSYITHFKWNNIIKKMVDMGLTNEDVVLFKNKFIEYFKNYLELVVNNSNLDITNGKFISDFIDKNNSLMLFLRKFDINFDWEGYLDSLILDKPKNIFSELYNKYIKTP